MALGRHRNGALFTRFRRSSLKEARLEDSRQSEAEPEIVDVAVDVDVDYPSRRTRILIFLRM